jgi:hypothetical protein
MKDNKNKAKNRLTVFFRLFSSFIVFYCLLLSFLAAASLPLGVSLLCPLEAKRSKAKQTRDAKRSRKQSKAENPFDRSREKRSSDKNPIRY